MCDSAVTIRAAKVEDIRQIKEIDTYIFEEDSYPLFALRQLFDISRDLLKVASLANEVVGYALGHHNQETGEAWLLSAGVLPKYRGRKIGITLLKALIEDIIAKGAKSILLTVQPKNKSGLYLYEKLGFATFQTCENYYLDHAPRLIMKKEII